MKKLPIGTQSFENLRKSDCIYVDKTGIIHRMSSEGRIYLLSRPRRFGKSLLISTMKMLFKGRQELFKDLYIGDSWDWTQQYPVIKIDWTLIDHSTPEKMEISIIDYLEDIARNYRVTLDANNTTGGITTNIPERYFFWASPFRGKRPVARWKKLQVINCKIL
jgi:hypothetical protein